MPILFARGNPHKVTQVASVLEHPLIQAKIDLPEVQAVDVRDVIEEKTKAAYEIVGQPVLVEDTSRCFKAWNGLPGALIKWFLRTVDNDGLCKMLFAFEDKSAIAETCIGYYDGVEFVVFSAKVEGTIVASPRDNKGFGWDPIFQPMGQKKHLQR
jgi:non-canonical purine NTP pyrophosphatase (RdgB/HAM1 family)